MTSRRPSTRVLGTSALVVLLAAWPATAGADKRVDDLRVGYEKEATGCKRSSDGLRKVADGAGELAKAAEGSDKADLERDADKLDKGSVVVKGYCDELDAAVEFIRANATATYKKLERELDERDNKIRRGRAASKKVLADLESVSHRLIPKINASRVSAPAPAPEKRTPAKFPSGRNVELPSIGTGTWKISGSTATDIAEYTEKTTQGIVTTRTFDHATCEQQRRVAGAGSDKVVELELGPAAKQLGLAWIVGFTNTKHAVQIGCAQRGDGGFLATADVTPDDSKLMTELAKLMLRMIAVQADKPPALAPH